MQLKGLVFLAILLLAPLVGSVRQIFNAAPLRSPAVNKEEGGPFIERVATSINAINDVASKGIKDELKLGVLFLNLGGPEKLKVCCKPCVQILYSNLSAYTMAFTGCGRILIQPVCRPRYNTPATTAEGVSVTPRLLHCKDPVRDHVGCAL
jgi:hypothetical protein